MTRLTVVSPAPPRAELDDLGEDETIDWLRTMVGISRDLCDAIDNYLGPPRPAQRPRLRIIPGGK